ncbi:nuclear transport factor 2 family protein [Natrialba swarupiae]|nr:nuclear transport factor 2 family protein [Natrialba swarupiae]
MDSRSVVRRYYDALDDHEYDALEDVLARDSYNGVPTGRSRTASRSSGSCARAVRIRTRLTNWLPSSAKVRRSRLAAASSIRTTLFEFADFFELEDGRIVELETYSR